MILFIKIIVKIIIGSIVSLVIAGIAVDAFLWLRKPQVIKLSDGTKLTLVGVTYGKHHVPPKAKIAGRSSRGNGAPGFYDPQQN